MTKMYILILSLIQAQPARIPKLVWGGAILVLLIGISLLVYFFSRLKKGEKEPEEDWSVARRSLFVESSKPAEEGLQLDPQVLVTEPSKSVAIDSTEAAPLIEAWQSVELASVEAAPLIAPEAPEQEEVAFPIGSIPPPPSDEQETLASTHVLEAAEPIGAEPATPNRGADEPTGVQERLVDERSIEPAERETELLVSSPGRELSGEVEVFGDDVWAELDHPAAQVTPEESRVVRLEQRVGREPFEPPRIRPLVGRQPFEPPRIDRLVPDTKQGPASEVQPGGAFPAEETNPQASFLSEAVGEPSVVSPTAGATKGPAHRKPAGSVLGLPLESSQSPLILGEPSRPSEDAGIGALSNYGKETGPEAGRGGTIVLLLTIALVGGGILAYLYVPSVHAKVDSIIARLRGSQTVETQAPAATGPRAQIFPARSEAEKNVVKARGTIYNTSSKPLDGLSVEVSLERGGDAAPDTRIIPVVPGRLEPRQQGRYEFEYDGSQATGYPSGYRVTKLLSAEGEIKFAAAGQPKSQ